MARIKQILFSLFFLLLCIFSQSSYALRLVALKPNITQTLIDIGWGDQIVGITSFCPKPSPHALVVADYVSVKAEDIIRLKPDFVLSSRENSQSRQYALLEAAGVTIKYFDFETLDDMLRSVSDLSYFLKDDAPQRAVLKIRMKLEMLQKSFKSQGLQDKTFTVIVQRKPLMIASGNTYISSLLASIGFSNVFEKNRISYPVIEEESFLRKKSDFVFDMSHGPGWGEPILGMKVFPLKIDDFLAAPRSITALEDLLRRLEKDASHDN
jgi:ABC-type Fe3+-hydroxamate transport system substrate-binding protein